MPIVFAFGGQGERAAKSIKRFYSIVKKPSNLPHSLHKTLQIPEVDGPLQENRFLKRLTTR